MRRIDGGMNKINGILLLFIYVCVVIVLFNGIFVDVINFGNVVKCVVLFGIIGIGVVFVIMIGGIDLLIGLLIGFVGCVLVMMFVVDYWLID